MKLRVTRQRELRDRDAEPPRRRGRLFRLGQLTLVLGFAGLLIGGWVYHRAEAQMSDQLTQLGGQMMRYAEADRQDTPRDLVVNGQTLRLSSGMTSRSAIEVLDHFETRCAELDGDLTRQMQNLAAEHPEIRSDVPRSPTLRRDDGRNGYVACLDLGEAPITVGELSQRLLRYGETGDIASVGQIRYAFAEQTGRGPEQRTHFVTLWTEGSLNMREMFPEAGDAPGRDVPGLRRPEGTRRVLSGWERGQPQSMTVYQTRATESSLQSEYRLALQEGGWSVLEHPERSVDPNFPRSIVAEHGDRMVTIVFGTDVTTGHASAAVFEAR